MTRGFEAGPIALAAGGTGGHMFPAEALAQELRRRGAEILLATDARGLRYAKHFPADAQFHISAATPSIGGPIAKAVAALSIARGLMTAWTEFGERKPIAAIGFGGYPSLPAMKAAAFRGIPYGVHEQNGVLGRANRLLAKGSVFLAHGFPALEKCPAGANAIEVGNPVRDAVDAFIDAPFPTISKTDKINILIFGGSQGASLFAGPPVEALTALPDSLRMRLQIVHQARDEAAASVGAAYEKAGVEAEVAPFFSDLPQRMAAAHLVVARAGASSVTELSTIGRPSILVPLAIAMDDHQTGNARVLSEANAAIILPENSFTKEAMMTALTSLLANPGRLQSMAEAAKHCVKRGAAVRLADLVEEMISARAPA